MLREGRKQAGASARAAPVSLRGSAQYQDTQGSIAGFLLRLGKQPPATGRGRNKQETHLDHGTAGVALGAGPLAVGGGVPPKHGEDGFEANPGYGHGVAGQRGEPLWALFAAFCVEDRR